MKYTYLKITSFIILGILLFWSCTEPFNAFSNSYEEMLVVEATITDSLQQHTVKLSKTTPIDSKDISAESGAQVWVESNTGEVFQFSETENGMYLSDIEFAAESGKSYTLHVITSNGKEYISSEENMPQKINLDIYPEIGQDDLGNEGVRILANTAATEDETIFVKYEYTEVYKIVTLVNIEYDYSLENIVLDDNPSDNNCYTDFDIIITPRTENSSICYSFPTVSNTIIQNSSSNYPENRITGMPVNFVSKSDYKLRERYSILVRAYSQNYNSYQYYSNIKKLNSSSSQLSFQQPGYIQGNITSASNNNENVLGYFNVWSLSQKRIFMDHNDFGFPQPPYFAELDAPTIKPEMQPCPGPTNNDIFFNYYVSGYQLNQVIPGGGGYLLINPECSDCRNYGNNYPPDYWEE